MAFFAGVGVSKNSQDSERAGHEAATSALKDSGIASADIAIVISSSVFDQSSVLKGVRSVLGETSIVGCTSAGAITGDGVQEQAVSLLVLHSDQAKFIPVKITGIGKDMRGAGRKFAEAIKAGGDSKKIADVREMIAENQKAIKALDTRYAAEAPKKDVWEGYEGGKDKPNTGQSGHFIRERKS